MWKKWHPLSVICERFKLIQGTTFCVHFPHLQQLLKAEVSASVTFQIVINERLMGAAAAPLCQLIRRGKTPSFGGANSFWTDVQAKTIQGVHK
jgi:hypothetical protein